MPQRQLSPTTDKLNSGLHPRDSCPVGVSADSCPAGAPSMRDPKAYQVLAILENPTLKSPPEARKGKYREASGTISHEKNGVCEISQTLKRAAKSFRNNKLNSQGCEVGFHLEVPSFLLAVYVRHLQEEIHPTVQKGCGITSQQKGDFAALCKMLPSARSDWLAMAATSSFQL
ncbi:hypothetical protein CK203_091333 [Vitis vinifera]|uniref:Uncharacterized protein n=1 Tax=Vitis vinifera TaxID=29760 RepID=A0A438CLJ9_VITVI|nr:hypothetical protein CK203_091333 [Vitis vinifera]